MKSTILRLCFGLGGAAALALVLFGSGADRTAPDRSIPLLGDVGARGIGPSNRYRLDAAGLLVFDAQKPKAPCPLPGARTAVILVMGQSNAANHAGQRFASEHGEKVVNFFEGACYSAASPLLGATGLHGEYWTPMADQLIRAGAYDAVVLAPLAVAGARIARFATGGDLNARVARIGADLAVAGLTPTHLLWAQGESDAGPDSQVEDYKDRFASLLETVRAQLPRRGAEMRVFIGVASKCLMVGPYAPGNAAQRAQRALGQSGGALRPGVDTDALLDELDRYDDCHFAGSGAAKAAAAWAEAVLRDRQAK